MHIALQSGFKYHSPAPASCLNMDNAAFKKDYFRALEHQFPNQQVSSQASSLVSTVCVQQTMGDLLLHSHIAN